MTKIQNILPNAAKSIQRLTRQFCLVGLLGFMCLTHTACHHEDDLIPEKQPEAISFGSVGSVSAGQQVTRAGEQNLETVLGELGVEKDFRVWCYKTVGYDDINKTYTNPQTVMDGYVVKWQNNTAGSTVTGKWDWEYAGIQNDKTSVRQEVKYWDYFATSYRYFGFAPAKADPSQITYSTASNHGDGFTWFDIDFPADAAHPENAPYISKLWFSNGNPALFPNHQYGQKVNMEFLKPVTKVRIMILDAEGNLIKDPFGVGFSSLKFAPTSGSDRIVVAGNLRVSYAITGKSTIANYLPSVKIVGDPTGTIAIDKKDETYSQYYQVLPCVEQNDYNLIGIIEEKQKIGVVPAEYMSWNPNMEYTYIFKLTEDDFKFIDIVQIGVTEWNSESSTHDFFNW